MAGPFIKAAAAAAAKALAGKNEKLAHDRAIKAAAAAGALSHTKASSKRLLDGQKCHEGTCDRPHSADSPC